MRFQLSNEITNLNHGSFGACPVDVYEVFEAFQRQLEASPDHVMRHVIGPKLKASREELERFLQVPTPLSVVFLPNVSQALCSVFSGLRDHGFFREGDELLTSSMEYGGCLRMLDVFTPPAKIVAVSFTKPIESHAQMLQEFFARVTGKTKLIYLSHIASPTGLILPIEEICRRAREMGIMTVIDGAHAPGQISVSLRDIDPDFYGANLHKWCCSPKTAGFLYARQTVQKYVEIPQLVSWGVGASDKFSPGLSGSKFVDAYSWPGTINWAAVVSVVKVIEFIERSGYSEKLRDSRALVLYGRREFAKKFGTEHLHLYPESEELFRQLVLLPLGTLIASAELSRRLWDEFKIVIPGIEFEGQHFLRLSVQVYTTQAQIDSLLDACGTIINSRQ